MPQEDGLQPKELLPTTSNFAATHCATCEAGMQITRLDGTPAIFCLLCRDWMSDKAGKPLLTDCSRYEQQGTA
jgi:hypothetical protein